MFPSSRLDPVILEHLLSQHRDLHARILALRAAFTPEEVPASPAAAEVRHLLLGLRDRLAEHFAQEEQGGFLEESIARMPRLSAAARGVVAEHPRLLAALDALLEHVPVRDIRPQEWSEARARFTDFADRLFAHERSEHAVVQQGYNEDFGIPE